MAMKRHSALLSLLVWALSLQGGNWHSMDFRRFPTEAACKAAGSKEEAEIKAQQATEAAADKRTYPNAINAALGPASYRCVEVKKQ
jgi:hypothetical protein